MFIVLAVMVAFLFLGNTAEACPTCKDGETAEMARGFYYSILFMISLPFVMLSGFGVYVFFATRQVKAKQKYNQAQGEFSPELLRRATPKHSQS